MSWAIPDLVGGESVSVTYSVHVKPNAYGITIDNLATPTSPGGTCATTCETQHPTPPRWILNKTADPPNGSTVQPGSTITYTLTATNIALGPLIGASAEDDLSAVLPFADLVTPLPAGLSLSGPTLTWTVPLIAVGGTASVSFSVTVHGDAHGVTIHNLATPTTPGGACELLPAPAALTALQTLAPLAASDPDVCSTDHFTPPTWTLTKSANPPSGATVEPGSAITYTLTAANTSQAPVIGASATDDLSKVLPFATLVSPLPAGLIRSGSTLTWTVPTIPVGATVTVSYAVTVNPNAFGVSITNLATPTSPDGSCPTHCTTTHHTPAAGSGIEGESAVRPGTGGASGIGAASGSGELAGTGIPINLELGWASVLLLLGSVLLVAARRRRRDTRR